MRLRNKIVKILLSRLLGGWSTGTVAAQRARQEKSNRFIKLPADISCQPISAAGVAAEWIEAPEAGTGVILYLHGGAYALGATSAHRQLAAQLAQTAKVRVLLLHYRLAPEHPFPAALDDVLSVYRWLLNQGIAAEQVVVAGDSAGGGLTIASLIALREAAASLPAGAICLSPWVDLALSGSTIHSKAKADVILDGDSLNKYAAYYAGNHKLTDPLLSPLYADLTDLPPLLIQVGTEEILLDDATLLAERAQAAGVAVTLKIWDEMVHVFQLFSFLPETKQAVAQIATFVTDMQRL